MDPQSVPYLLVTFKTIYIVMVCIFFMCSDISTISDLVQGGLRGLSGQDRFSKIV